RIFALSSGTASFPPCEGIARAADGRLSAAEHTVRSAGSHGGDAPQSAAGQRPAGTVFPPAADIGTGASRPHPDRSAAISAAGTVSCCPDRQSAGGSVLQIAARIGRTGKAYSRRAAASARAEDPDAAGGTKLRAADRADQRLDRTGAGYLRPAEGEHRRRRA